MEKHASVGTPISFEGCFTTDQLLLVLGPCFLGPLSLLNYLLRNFTNRSAKPKIKQIDCKGRTIKQPNNRCKHYNQARFVWSFHCAVYWFFFVKMHAYRRTFSILHWAQAIDSSQVFRTITRRFSINMDPVVRRLSQTSWGLETSLYTTQYTRTGCTACCIGLYVQQH
jgi:hypothetical protein